MGCIAAAAGALLGPARGLDTSMLPPPDPWRYLALQRSQALLAASTDRSPHPVRVLFYGQSITEQPWWRTTAAALQQAFPRARLVITNRSIPGFEASLLLKTAEVDVYPFRPDLIIFHSYGGMGPGREWDELLRRFRRRTTADVLLLGNHVNRDQELHEPIRPDAIEPRTEAWQNYVLAPALAHELGLCFPDNRTAWKAYLNAKQLPVSALLLDQWHLNADGCNLQSAILRPYLRIPRLTPPLNPFHNGWIASRRVGPGGLEWAGNRLRLEFLGNRVDVVAGIGPARHCRVLVDGRVPTSLARGRGHGRTSSWKGDVAHRPALLQVGFEQPLIPERWTLTLTEVSPSQPLHFRFSVSGSATGPDGSGVSTNRFVSHSGRVVIGPDDWHKRQPAGQDQLGRVLAWNSEDRNLDDYVSQAVAGQSTEPVTTLVNDLPDGPHVLELIADSADALPSITQFRIHHPAGQMPGSETGGNGKVIPRYLRLGPEFMTVWSASARDWHPVRAPSLDGPWRPVQEGTTNVFSFQGIRWRPEGDRGFFSLGRD